MDRKKIGEKISQIKDCTFLTSDGFYKEAISKSMVHTVVTK